MSKVLVVGSLNFDQVLEVPSFPAPGETIQANGLSFAFGGKGANQAVAAKRMGADVWMIGAVGDDEPGKNFIDHLTKEGVNINHLQRLSGQSTGTANIQVASSGENIIILYPGANDRLTVDHLLPLRSLCAPGDCLLVQLEIPLEVVFNALRYAKEQGATTILDPAPVKDIPPEFWQYVDIVAPNEIEAHQITGTTPKDLASAQTAAQFFLEGGVQTVIFTLGSKGAILVDWERAVYIHSYQVQAVDTTAAGDAFIGAFAAELNSGLDYVQLVQLANGAGALATTKKGAQSSLPSRKEVLAFCKEKGPAKSVYG